MDNFEAASTQAMGSKQQVVVLIEEIYGDAINRQANSARALISI